MYLHCFDKQKSNIISEIVPQPLWIFSYDRIILLYLYFKAFWMNKTTFSQAIYSIIYVILGRMYTNSSTTNDIQNFECRSLRNQSRVSTPTGYIQENESHPELKDQPCLYILRNSNTLNNRSMHGKVCRVTHTSWCKIQSCSTINSIVPATQHTESEYIVFSDPWIPTFPRTHPKRSVQYFYTLFDLVQIFRCILRSSSETG